MAKNIALLTGGDSSEWQIALQGAANIEKILDRSLYNPYTIVLRDKPASRSSMISFTLIFLAILLASLR